MTLAYEDGIPYALFKIDRETTSGTVDGVEYKPWGDYFLSYSFSDQNGYRHSKTRLVNRNLPFKTRNSNSIEVTFSPQVPKINEVTPLVPFLKSGFWIMVVGATFVFLASVSSVFSVLQLIKHRKEDRHY